MIPVRALKNEGMEEFKALQLELIRKLDTKGGAPAGRPCTRSRTSGSARFRRAVQDGDMQRGSLMAGQSVGLAGEVKPLADIMTELVTDAEGELERVAGLLAG